MERACELIQRARTDDGCGHDGIGEEPGERDVGRFLTQLVAQRPDFAERLHDPHAAIAEKCLLSVPCELCG